MFNQNANKRSSEPHRAVRSDVFYCHLGDVGGVGGPDRSVDSQPGWCRTASRGRGCHAEQIPISVRRMHLTGIKLRFETGFFDSGLQAASARSQSASEPTRTSGRVANLLSRFPAESRSPRKFPAVSHRILKLRCQFVPVQKICVILNTTHAHNAMQGA